MTQSRVISFDMGSRNMAYACVEAPSTILQWGMIDLREHQSRIATDNLVHLLESESMRWMRDSHYDIVVEQQPSSGVCKTLSHCLQTYFLTVDLVDQRPPRKFCFMSPGNKLKFDPSVYDEVRPTNHAERKIVSIRVVEKYATAQYKEWFATRNPKQKTDLADAYIQACRYLQGGKQQHTEFMAETSDFNPRIAAMEARQEAEEEAFRESLQSVEFV